MEKVTDNSVFFSPSIKAAAFGKVYAGFTPAIITAPTFPEFISATSFATAASFP